MMVTFNWWYALCALCIFGFPFCAIAAIIAFATEHPILATFLTIGAFLLITIMGGLPEEVFR